MGIPKNEWNTTHMERLNPEARELLDKELRKRIPNYTSGSIYDEEGRVREVAEIIYLQGVSKERARHVKEGLMCDRLGPNGLNEPG